MRAVKASAAAVLLAITLGGCSSTIAAGPIIPFIVLAVVGFIVLSSVLGVTSGSNAATPAPQPSPEKDGDESQAQEGNDQENQDPAQQPVASDQDQEQSVVPIVYISSLRQGQRPREQVITTFIEHIKDRPATNQLLDELVQKGVPAAAAQEVLFNKLWEAHLVRQQHKIDQFCQDQLPLQVERIDLSKITPEIVANYVPGIMPRDIYRAMLDVNDFNEEIADAKLLSKLRDAQELAQSPSKDRLRRIASLLRFRGKDLDAERVKTFNDAAQDELNSMMESREGNWQNASSYTDLKQGMVVRILIKSESDDGYDKRLGAISGMGIDSTTQQVNSAVLDTPNSQTHLSDANWPAGVQILITRRKIGSEGAPAVKPTPAPAPADEAPAPAEEAPAEEAEQEPVVEPAPEAVEEAPAPADEAPAQTHQYLK